MSDLKPCGRCGQPHARCTAHRRDGEPCGQRPVKGTDVCKMHGGLARQVRAAGQRRLEEQAAQAAVVTLGLPRDISPTEALLEEVRWTAGHVQWLRTKVQELEEDWDDEHGQQHALTWGVTRSKTGGDDHGVTSEAAPNVWYVLYERERKHLVQVAAAALKAGVEERRVRLAEQQGEMVAGVIRRVLDGMLDQLLAAGMAATLRDVWQASVVEIVPRELRALAAGGGAS